MNNLDKYIGCLLGGAIGDALGAPVEFLSQEEIIRQFGSRGITNYAPAYGGIGKITDDTQMTLFTAEGMLRSLTRGSLRGIGSETGCVEHACHRWLETQNLKSPKIDELDGWLIRHQELFSERAPGRTCILSLGTKSGRNGSKGCGGVMRTAPCGLYAASRGRTAPAAFEFGIDVCAITHGHPTGQITGGFLAAMICELANGKDLMESINTAMSIAKTKTDYEETTKAVDLAVECHRRGMEPLRAIELLGEGWIAEEALAISIFCALSARDFDHGVIMAVNHGGDSDSTGAITGNILGALWGERVIDRKWLEPMELREVIREMAGDLHECGSWEISDYNYNDPIQDAIVAKYPGW